MYSLDTECHFVGKKIDIVQHIDFWLRNHARSEHLALKTKNQIDLRYTS